MQPSTHSDAGDRLVLLDGLRGLAAIGTVLFHVNIDGSAPAFARGYLFVDFFFLLSGFVLTLAFEPRFGARLDWKVFFASRFRRFWPLAALGTAIGGVTLQLGGLEPVGLIIAVLCGATMLPILAKGMLYPANAPQWSLLIELILNLAHAVLLHRLKLRRLAVLTAGLGALAAIGIVAGGTADRGANAPDLPFALARAGWCYCLGILLARAWRRPHRSRCDWRLALALPVAHVTGLTLLPLPVWLGDAATVLLVLPALFWLATQAIPPPAAQPALSRLGAISFPLYALHFPLILLWEQLLDSGISRLSALPFVLAVTLAVTWLLPGAVLGRGSQRSAAAA